MLRCKIEVLQDVSCPGAHVYAVIGGDPLLLASKYLHFATVLVLRPHHSGDLGPGRTCTGLARLPVGLRKNRSLARQQPLEEGLCQNCSPRRPGIDAVSLSFCLPPVSLPCRTCRLPPAVEEAPESFSFVCCPGLLFPGWCWPYRTTADGHNSFNFYLDRA